jgi:hypothetical protein
MANEQMSNYEKQINSSYESTQNPIKLGKESGDRRISK